MAGPFDSYEVPFSKPLSNIDTSFYANALAMKKQQYDRGFQQAQSLVDNVAGLPVGNEADKKYLQGVVNNLTSKINDLSPDFSDTSTLNSIKSMSRTMANDTTLQTAITSAANYKTAYEKYQKIKDKGDETYNPANEDLFMQEVSAYKGATKPGKAFDAEYIPAFDTFKYALDQFNGINPNEQIVQKDDGYYYMHEHGQSKLEPAQVETMLKGVMQTSPKLLRQLGIEAQYRYKSYTPEELKNVIYDMHSQQIDSLSAAAHDAALKAALYKDGTEDKEQLKGVVDQLTNEYGTLVKQKEGFDNSIAQGDLTGARNFIYKNVWMNSVINQVVGKAGSKTSDKFSESIIGKVNREVQRDLNKQQADAEKRSKVGDIPLGPTIPQGVNTEAEKASTYSQLTERINQAQDEKISYRNEVLYNNLPKEITDIYFNTPQERFDASGVAMPIKYSVKEGKEKELQQKLNDLRADYQTGNPNLSPELRNYFRFESGQDRIIKAQTEAKLSADKTAQEALKSDPNYQTLQNINIPTTIINYNGKDQKITKEDVINYAKVLDETSHTENTDFVTILKKAFSSYGGAARDDSPDRRILEQTAQKYGLSADKMAAINQSPFSTNILPLYKLIKPTVDNSVKEKDNALRKYQDAIDYGEQPILFGKDEAAPANLSNIVSTAYQSLDKSGRSDYSDLGDLLAKYSGDKFKNLSLSYSEPKGQPTIIVSEPGSKDRYPIPIDQQTAKDLKFLKGSNPLNQDFELLRWRRKPGGQYSSTANGFEDAPEYDVFQTNNKDAFQIKYKIDQKPTGYYLTVYTKPVMQQGQKINGQPVIADQLLGINSQQINYPDAQALENGLNQIVNTLKSKLSTTDPQTNYISSLIQDYK